MLTEPIFEKLQALRLYGMREGLEEQMTQAIYRDLTFEERLGLLVDREWSRRENNRLKRRIQTAGFRETALMADVDTSASRGLDRKDLRAFAQGDWIGQRLNIIITGPTGAGKTYVGCAIGREVCQRDFSVRYSRTCRLLHDLIMARGDGTYGKLLNTIAKTHLLILDDWLRDPLTSEQTREVLEIMDDRYQQSSTMIISQIPVTQWHERLGDPTLADAILDRMVHNAYKLQLKGESRRKLRGIANKTKGEDQ